MKETELQALAKAGKIEEVKQTEAPETNPQDVSKEEIAAAVSAVREYLPLIQMLRSVKRPLTAAPTNTPKTLLDMFEVYDTGGVRRLYLYVGTTWRYVALT